LFQIQQNLSELLCPIPYWTDEIGRNGTKQDEKRQVRQMTEEQEQEEIIDV
jgi:hypothetical protein